MRGGGNHQPAQEPMHRQAPQLFRGEKLHLHPNGSVYVCVSIITELS